MATASPEHIADEMYLAMKGLGTDEKRLTKAISGVDHETIAKVKEVFTKKYHKDLWKEVKSETSGNYKRLLKGVLMDPVTYDAKLLHQAMKGLGTKDEQLTEVLVCRHPNHLKKVSKRFAELYGKSLNEWITKDTSGDYCKFLLALASGEREDNAAHVIQAKVDADVHALFTAGEGRAGTDEKIFIEVFAKRSWKHIRKVAEQYSQVHSHSLQTAIKKEFSGDIERALYWALEFYEHRPAFFAKRLYNSMVGLGTRDVDLVRIVATRREADLYEIAQEYLKIYNKTLKEAFDSETSGDYKVLLGNILKGCE